MARKGTAFLLIFFVFAVFMACSKDETPAEPDTAAVKEAEPPQAEEEASEETIPQEITASDLAIIPAKATKASVLEARMKGVDLEDASLVWLVNDAPMSTPRIKYFDTPDLEVQKGDTIQAVAVVDGDEVRSNIVTIQNALPQITGVKLVPEVLAPGQNIGVEVEAKDPDGDEVTIQYEWKVNDFPAGVTAELGSAVQRGDIFELAITPYDGEEYGKTRTVTRKVGNVPPRITEQYNYIIEGQTFIYDVEATDPDGDPLNYFLSSAPAGMIINSSTGEVRWEVPPDYTG
ncbi:MAG: hypothetical protein GWN77_01810, partial [Gammaproteobacteria bacterium]|nr:hypothetical protein [Gammaproteobacteria bacterium]